MGHAQEPRDDPPPNPAAAAQYVHRSVVGGVQVIELHFPPELDSDAFDAVNAALLAAVDAAGNGGCVLDLTAVEYVGSNMLGLMVNARQRCKAAGGRLALCGLSAWFAQTLRTCSLERLFVTTPTRAAALKAVGKK